MADESVFWRLREWINTGIGRIVIIVITLALVAGAAIVATMSVTSPEKDAEETHARGAVTLYLCKACGATGKTHKETEAKFPLECPQCKKRKAVAAFKCFRCEKTIEAVYAPLFRCRHCKYVYDYSTLAPPEPVRR
ncbi:hypothetical protein LCGC14_2216420 [marine sediment metagenome]|uniref:Uncharacterized protein n=1 Tax=marine sediment metagenome TaxID=412755 RepID=A0A0F9DZS3_9ZZZZ